jgi:hypothetical protein
MPLDARMTQTRDGLAKHEMAPPAGFEKLLPLRDGRLGRVGEAIVRCLHPEARLCGTAIEVWADIVCCAAGTLLLDAIAEDARTITFSSIAKIARDSYPP